MSVSESLTSDVHIYDNERERERTLIQGSRAHAHIYIIRAHTLLNPAVVVVCVIRKAQVRQQSPYETILLITQATIHNPR